VPPSDWETLPLGDIMVCPDVVAKNASENNRTEEEETVLVISHGLLHLIGRDHDTEEREATMWREQDALVEEYFKAVQ
ncbi:MAG: rRNA maturation RNase YbeY, partial [Synergistaceae bacterium]